MRVLLALCLLLSAVAVRGAESEGIEAFRSLFRSVTPKTFDSGGEIARQFHLESGAYLEMATIARTGPAHPLPEAIDPAVAAQTVRWPDGEGSLDGYVQGNAYVDGALVLHGGEIVYEAYPRMAPWQRHFSWSVSKVVLSTALAVLVDEERVDPEAGVETYLPELAGTVWDGVAVRDVANMASGVDCRDSDGYQTSTTCIYRLEESLGITAETGYDGGLLAHLQSIERRGPAGARYEYASANTIVMGLILEAVSGQSFADFARERLWAPMGAEADALVAISPEGFAYTSGGVALRLRDLARFGALHTRPEGFGVLSEAMLADIQGGRGVALDPGRAEARDAYFFSDAPVRASWQWDHVWSDGALYKGGYSGQGLYVDPDRDLVVAWFGTGEDFSARRNDLLTIARQLATSGRFEGE